MWWGRGDAGPWPVLCPASGAATALTSSSPTARTPPAARGCRPAPPRHSSLGMEAQSVIEAFLSQLPPRFTTDERGPVVFNSVVIEVDPETGKAGSIQRIDCEVA